MNATEKKPSHKQEPVPVHTHIGNTITCVNMPVPTNRHFAYGLSIICPID